MQNQDWREPLIYDALNRWAADDNFFLGLANETPHSRVVDLGCGTGRLTLALAQAGHAVTGVDPDHASLEAAKRKEGAERVTWELGTSSILSSSSFDLTLMTSHVAQVFVDDAAWLETLADIRRALVPGGRLAFDSRDPAVDAREVWSGDDATHVHLPDGSQLAIWTQVEHVSGRNVSFRERCLDMGSGEETTSESTLCYRSEQELRASLESSGFTVDHVFGGWRNEPVGQGNGEFVFIARALDGPTDGKAMGLRGGNTLSKTVSNSGTNEVESA